MSIVKIQHYVPRFYLRNFSNKINEGYKIHCFDKKENKQFETNIENIACEKFFYEDSNGSQKIEKGLAKLEGMFNETLTKLIKLEDISRLTTDDRYMLSLFIAIQFLRSKEKRKGIEDMIKQLSERLSKENLSTELEKELEELKDKNAIRSFHTSLLIEAPKFADIIFSMKWLLLINKTKTLFWTSDSPTYLHNEIDHWPYGSLGLTKIGIEMHLPITPRIALVCCDPLSFVHEPNKKIIRDFRHLIRLLSYQVYSSTRFLFSNNDNFKFAQTVIRENPLYRDMDRKRTTVS